jgi:hypothetical protein
MENLAHVPEIETEEQSTSIHAESEVLSSDLIDEPDNISVLEFPARMPVVEEPVTPVVSGGGADLSTTESTLLAQQTEAKRYGFEGDACAMCGEFKMVRSGTCLKCMVCGETTGCS